MADKELILETGRWEPRPGERLAINSMGARAEIASPFVRAGVEPTVKVSASPALTAIASVPSQPDLTSTKPSEPSR